MDRLLKFTIVVAFVFLIGPSCNAQLRFGFKTGVNANDVVQSFQDSLNSNYTKKIFGFHMGVSIDYEIFKWVSLTSGLTFITKGYALDLEKYNSELYYYTGSSKLRYNYLEIPLNITLKKNNLCVYGGPYIGLGINGRLIDNYIIHFETIADDFTIKGKVDAKAEYGSINLGDQNEFELYRTSFNGIDFGYNVGVGYLAGPLLINVSYSLGIPDIRPKITNGIMLEDKLINRVFSFSWTYML